MTLRYPKNKEFLDLSCRIQDLIKILIYNYTLIIPFVIIFFFIFDLFFFCNWEQPYHK